jgi:hypothetical protein
MIFEFAFGLPCLLSVIALVSGMWAKSKMGEGGTFVEEN